MCCCVVSNFLNVNVVIFSNYRNTTTFQTKTNQKHNVSNVKQNTQCSVWVSKNTKTKHTHKTSTISKCMVPQRVMCVFMFKISKCMIFKMIYVLICNIPQCQQFILFVSFTIHHFNFQNDKYSKCRSNCQIQTTNNLKRSTTHAFQTKTKN